MLLKPDPKEIKGEIKFTNEPLVIETDLGYDIQLKNICVNVEESGYVGGPDIVRTIALLKLPELLFPNGYTNLLGKKEEWIPIYRSSGSNSGNKGAWYPCLGEINSYLQNKTKIFLPYLEELGKPLSQNLYPISQWKAKCGAIDTFSSFINADSKNLPPGMMNDISMNNRLLLSEKIENIKKIFTNNPYPDAFNEYKNNKDKNKKRSYFCSSFFKKIDDTLQEKLSIDNGLLETKITTDGEIIKMKNFMYAPPEFNLQNIAIGPNNIFGFDLTRVGPSPKIENILSSYFLENEKGAANFIDINGIATLKLLFFVIKSNIHLYTEV